MGGKKRLTLKQMEKQSRKQARQKRSGASDATAPRDKKAPGIIPPDIKDPKVIEEVKKIKVLTPYAVASRFNIRLSTARDFLKQLEEKGVIKFVSRSRNVRIYTPAD
ncbi:MAG TPA: hypothetical protein ENF76_06435 [Candidatus Bathyarchaeota archaeon]|nr:MAG: hypothetical protein DRO50_02190 [Candidatus Bathyarchaeota archaeon]HDI07982.1 hypothetical protein [Candidatus Bathyarchaeota archaeon]